MSAFLTRRRIDTTRRFMKMGKPARTRQVVVVTIRSRRMAQSWVELLLAAQRGEANARSASPFATMASARASAAAFV